MRLRMTARMGVLVWLTAGLLASVSPAQSQAPGLPRMADGKPDFSGIWQAMGSAHWNLEPHVAEESPVLELGALGAIPGGPGVVVGDVIPYQPHALAKKAQHYENRLQLDPVVKCHMPGVPRAMYLPLPFQIVQGDQHIMMVFEFSNFVRTVYMDNHVEAPAESYMGWSNGYFDGDTLVIETTAFNDLTWFDHAGNYHSNALRVIERIRPRTADTLIYEATIIDPQVYTRPWQIRLPLYRRVEEKAELMEFRCVEFVEDLVYGHLYKEPVR